MRPLKVKRHQYQNGMDFTSDVVLDLISDFPDAVQTQHVITVCTTEGIAHPVQVARCIRLLKHLGFVASHKNPNDDDGRKRYIKITQKGLAYLNVWEGV